MVFTTEHKKIIKIDAKDKKIITYLNSDANIQRKKLAKELNIGEPSLNYKIQRLEKNIISPILLLNFRKLGFSHYNILLDKVTKGDMIKLDKSKEVSVILEVFGSKKIILEIITKDLSMFLDKYLSNKKVEIIELINDLFYNSNIFNLDLNKKLLFNKSITKKNDEYVLTKIDAKILLKLAENPLLSILGIAKETKLNRQTVANHLKILQDNNIIYNTIFGINAYTLGFEEYFIKINLPSSQKKEALKVLLQNLFIIGSCESFQDICCYIMVPNYRDLAELVEKIEHTSESTKVEVFQILHTKKILNLPDIVKVELERVV